MECDGAVGEVAWRAPGCQQEQNLFLISYYFFIFMIVVIDCNQDQFSTKAETIYILYDFSPLRTILTLFLCQLIGYESSVQVSI